MLFALRAANAAARLHAEQPFDAFWAMMSYMLFPIVLLRLVGVRPPYLLTLQEGDPFERVFHRPHIAFFRPLLAAGFRHASAVQAISAFLGAWAARAGYSGTPVVIGNGVDIARFARERGAGEREHARQDLGARAGDVLLVTTSRLVEKNAVDDVIRALRHLPAQVRFIVYGAGPERDALEKLARDTGVSARVRFMGHVSHEDLPRALHACDLFVRPSRTEGMGNSFIEAMAAGLPVIATQEGGIADFLFDAERDAGVPPTGWAVGKDAPDEIAAAVRRILGNPEQAARVTENARKLVVERYEWAAIARRMQGLLARVADARRVGTMAA
jgi:glycosyltransferase involved in cell wall biosynthesis